MWRVRCTGSDRLHAEINDQKISRYDKSVLRQMLTIVRTFQGTPIQVRSEFENRCMAYKRKHGYSTEKEVASGGSRRAHAAEAGARQAEAEARRAEDEGRRAQARAEQEARQAQARAEMDARLVQARVEREARLAKARADAANARQLR